MSTIEHFPLVYLYIAAFISSCVAFFAFRNHPARGRIAFALTCIASIVWTVGDIVSRSTPTLEGQWAGTLIHFLGVVALPAGVFIFVFQYFGAKVTAKRIALTLVMPAITWLVVLTNEWHGLFFESHQLGTPDGPKFVYGPYFWYVHLPFCYLMLIAVFAKTIHEMTREKRHYRVQAIILFCSFLVPFVSNVVGVFELFGDDVSYTALSFPIFFAALALGIFRFQLLRSAPVAYESVFQNIRDGVLILDKNDVIRDINKSAMRGIGTSAEGVIGLHVRDAFRAWPEAVKLYDRKALELGEIEVDLRGRQRYLQIDSIAMDINDPEAGRVITIQDITDRHQHQRSLEALAFHDPLTRVANRRKFYEEFENAIDQVKDDDERISLLYFDLNGFKAVNDRHGHDVGDQFLGYIAARAASVLRKPDLLGRLGGDEFGVLLHGCDEDGVGIVVERLLEHVTRPFEVEGVTLVADLSIGASVFPDHGEELGQLLRHADRAMYRAKREGGGFMTASGFVLDETQTDM